MLRMAITSGHVEQCTTGVAAYEQTPCADRPGNISYWYWGDSSRRRGTQRYSQLRQSLAALSSLASATAVSLCWSSVTCRPVLYRSVTGLLVLYRSVPVNHWTSVSTPRTGAARQRCTCLHTSLSRLVLQHVHLQPSHCTSRRGAGVPYRSTALLLYRHVSSVPDWSLYRATPPCGLLRHGYNSSDRP